MPFRATWSANRTNCVSLLLPLLPLNLSRAALGMLPWPLPCPRHTSLPRLPHWLPFRRLPRALQITPPRLGRSAPHPLRATT